MTALNNAAYLDGTGYVDANGNWQLVSAATPLPITAGSGGGTISPGAIQTNQAPYDTQIDYNGGSNATYVGYAAPGTATSASTWQIKFITYDGSNNPLTITYANGSGAFSFQWTLRASYSYS